MIVKYCPGFVEPHPEGVEQDLCDVEQTPRNRELNQEDAKSILVGGVELNLQGVVLRFVAVARYFEGMAERVRWGVPPPSGGVLLDSGGVAKSAEGVVWADVLPLHH